MSGAELTPAAAALLAPGGPYEVRQTTIGDAEYPLLVNAPDNLQQLYHAALAHGQQDFYVFDDERYSFAQAWQLAQRTARALQTIGVSPGDRVGIALRNYPEWLWAFMGITSMGAVAVCMNAWWTADELAYGIEDSGLTTLFVDHERQTRLAEAHLPRELKVVTVRCAATFPNSTTWAEFIDLSDNSAADWLYPVGAEDIATILYTSGSTAHPKGVVATHRSIVHALLGWEAAAALATAQLDEPPPPLPYQPAMILSVPLFHVTGLNVQFLSSFRAGRKLVGMYKWDPEQALELIERERVTAFNGVPTMSYELVRSPSYQQRDLSSLQSMGGAAPRWRRNTLNKLINAVLAPLHQAPVTE